jgi:hypothetical protein
VNPSFVPDPETVESPQGKNELRRKPAKHIVVTAIFAALAYFAAYAIARQHGTLYTYYSQGSYEIDVTSESSAGYLIFLPVMVTEGALRSAFQPAPSGG